MLSLNGFDYSIVVGYLLIMILIGFFLAKVNKNDQDYFKGGGKIPWPLSSLSLFIGAFSAYMFVAASGQAYKCGIPSLLLFTSAFLPYVLAALYWAKLWRRARITSPMEYVEMRFGPSTKSLLTLISVPLGFIGSGNSLYCVCIFMSSALGLTGTYSICGIGLNGLQIALISIGIVIILYTAVGGLWAVVVTDTVQFVIIMVVAITVCIASIYFIGGSGSSFAAIGTLMHNPPNPGYFKLVNSDQTLFFTLTYMALTLVSTPAGFSLIQRSSCVSDEAAATKTSAMASVFFLIAPVLWLLPVFIMRNSLPDLGQLWPQLKNPNEAAYLTIALKLLPHGMIGLTVAAILAATLSSLSVSYNIMAMVAAHDIYKPFFAPKADSRHLMVAGKVLTIVYGILAIIMGLLLAGYSDAFHTTIFIASHVVIACSFPMFLGMLTRRVPWWLFIVSMPVCMLCTLSIDIFVPLITAKTNIAFFTHANNHLWEYKVCAAIIVNLILFGIGYFRYKESDAAAGADELFRRFKKPVCQDEAREIEVVVPNLRAYRLVGYSLAVFGVPLILFSLVMPARDPKRIDMIVGLVLILMWAILHWITGERSPFKSVRRQISAQKAAMSVTKSETVEATI